MLDDVPLNFWFFLYKPVAICELCVDVFKIMVWRGVEVYLSCAGDVAWKIQGSNFNQPPFLKLLLKHIFSPRRFSICGV